ncbi:MAG: DUF86 domain-containing protein [Undibacterium sp.]|nr:DUF86 domain-containing protein [Opitutaceae bacterium]
MFFADAQFWTVRWRFMLDNRQAGLLTDVLDSARSIRTYLDGVNREAFLNDAEKQDAVLRRFEIVDEAASRLAPETQARFPAPPFRAMRGMRNIIAHD